jgi:hypothetical protein
MWELDLTQNGRARGVYAEKGNAYNVLLEKTNTRDNVVDVCVCERLLLKWILK